MMSHVSVIIWNQFIYLSFCSCYWKILQILIIGEITLWHCYMPWQSCSQIYDSRNKYISSVLSLCCYVTFCCVRLVICRFKHFWCAAVVSSRVLFGTWVKSHTIFWTQFPVNVIRKCNLQETEYLTKENIVDHQNGWPQFSFHVLLSLSLSLSCSLL
jgi:hypothetical protein